MTKKNNKQDQMDHISGSNNILSDSIKVLTDLTRKDIERIYNLENTKNTETFYSNRHGWHLRRVNS